jgi:RNA-dependent RNA polymerase
VLMVKPSLEGWRIEIRNSNMKYPSDETKLEVIRCATFSQAYLNRQVIMLLECIGVEDEVFLQLLSEHEKQLEVGTIISKL